MALFGAYFGLPFCCFNIQILKGPCDDNKLQYLFMYCLVFALVIRHLKKLIFTILLSMSKFLITTSTNDIG